MCEVVLRECLSAARGLDPARTALFLLVSERDRPGYTDAWGQACLAAARGVVGAQLHPDPQIVSAGRPGLGEAMRAARQILREGRARHAVIAGVDSYLNTHTVNHFLARGRLLASDVSDGFIPGEGAAALLLELSEPDAPGLHVLGIGTAEEPARVDNDEPARGVGRARAIREALAESGHRMSELHFQMADLSGESFYFNELAAATARAFDRKIASFPLLCLAESVGEIGAAIGPLSLAYLADALARGHAPGTRGIVHLAGDDGRRASLVVQHRPGPPARPPT
jgi:3-oxoacyl-[acyl-carrier-protein] synthase-1